MRPALHGAKDPIASCQLFTRACLVHGGGNIVQAPCAKGAGWLMILHVAHGSCCTHQAGHLTSSAHTAEWCGQTLQASQLCWACMAHAEGSLTVRRYSKEVQGVLMAIERFKRQHCQDSDELYYQRLRMMDLEEDWELRWLLHSPLSDELSGALFVPKASGTARS